MTFNTALLLLIAAISASAGETAVGAAHAPRRPNIIFILADDLGYADLGCYGQQKIQTPRLDRMAEEGLRFTQAYCGTSVCAPSRCILMTGLHAGHSHVRANRSAGPGAELPLPTGTLTVARLLQQSGYRTACIGKWGLGGANSTGAPNKQGFDHFFGYIGHGEAHEYYPPYLWRNGAKVELDGKRYSHDLIVSEAMQWVRAHRADPFFLYLPFTIPHANLQVPDLGPYADKPWPPPQQKIAAMITRMDAGIGQLLDLLRELAIDEHTIVFFASDNGPDRGGVREFFRASGTFRGAKRGMYEGGLRVPMIVRWPGHVPAKRVSDEPWAFWDFLPTCAELAGAKLPLDAKIDGLSIVPALMGGAMPQRPYFYWEIHEPRSSQAVRFGNMKAVRPAWSAPIELYDLAADPDEKHDLAKEKPELIEKAEQIMREARVDSPLFPIIYNAPATAPARSQPAGLRRPAARRPRATQPAR